MLRVLFRGLAATVGLAAALGALSAHAADQPVYAPAPGWVKPIPIPQASTAGDGGPTKVLLESNQTKLTPDSDDYFTETATQVLSPQGLSQLGNLQQTWDPATETLIIHKLRVIRGDKTIDLLAGDKKFAVLRRETSLDLAMIDGRLTANFQPEGLQVGDVLDFAYTLQQRDPALGGYSTHFAVVSQQGVATRVYFRTIYPSALPIHWKTTEGIKQPMVGKLGDLTEVTVDDANVEALKYPVGAPARFGEIGIIGFSQYRDWQELSARFAPLYDKAAALAPNSPLRAEAAKIAAASKDPRVRALAALRLVEDQVRYVFLGVNDGGLVPAAVDDSWSRRFADCKGKTVMLVALLRELGIEAAPALVNTTNGDGMDGRLPTAGWFDHAIVRVRIAGKTYWFDGTRAGDRSLDTMVIPPWGWALPLSTAGEPLQRLDPPPLTEASQEQSVVIDASKSATAPAPAKITVTFRSEAAVSARAQLASLPRADYERGLRESFAKSFSWFNITKLDIRDDATAGVFQIATEGMAKLDWTDVSGGARVYRVPGSAFSGQVARREPGLHADAPYQAAYPSFTRNVWRITLPLGPAYTLIGRNVDRTLAGLALKRTAKLDAGVLFVESTGRALTPEWPASEADSTIEALRDLGRSDVAILAPPATAPVSSATASVKPVTARPLPAYLAGTSAAKSAAIASQVQQSVSADREGANHGDAAAQLRLGQRYAHGDGVPIDMSEAVVWLQKAAAASNADAEIELGQAYVYGRGVGADTAKANALFRKAADQGSAAGQRLVGEAYMRGEGVPTDLTAAQGWLEKAAAQGDGPAKRMLDEIKSSSGKAGG